ncbi:MAG: beta-phosphoglucomutase family hydrolase [Bacteroidales bacterium]|nr:beta-phosphoglucomutase family hydrolase [Bacteroidales bacterium]
MKTFFPDKIIPTDTEALIFDLDGTLADTMPLHLKAWIAALKRFNLHYPENEMMQYAGLSTYKIAGEIIRDYNQGRDTPDPMELAKIKVLEFDQLQKYVRPIDPVVQLSLKYLNKLPMAVGTGGTRDTALKTLDLLDLKKYFPILVAAEDVDNHKPEPDTFLRCAELLNVNPNKCVVFEDGDRGVEAGERAGMTVVDIRKYGI